MLAKFVSSFHLNSPSRSMRLRLFFILLLFVSSVAAQSINPSLHQNLRHRCIGPFRAGRAVGAVVPQGGKPNALYLGVNNGGGSSVQIFRVNNQGNAE
jgi:hypothetical protein